ncbi:hypothetical protein FQR65_LT16455 [Abscondita terminalis]|nr:hypothetical protein FQR65_LT16455 [Abscondita terminalis]
MSMSATEILINCEKQLSLLEKEIDFSLSNIQKLIDKCKQIDNSNIFEDKLNQFILKFKNLKVELKDNAFEKEISKVTHVAIEMHNEIKNFIYRKKENQEFALSKTKSEILEIVKNDIDKFVSSENRLIENAIFDAKQKYGPIDVDIIKGIDKYILELKNSPDTISAPQKVKLFEEKVYNYAENIITRKDNVIKIIKSIRKMGYIVTEEDVRKFEKENIVSINATKPSGETLQFAIQLDGKLLINSEGFEKEDHDIEFKNLIDEFKNNNLAASTPLEIKYREPKYVAKHQKINKKENKNK